MKLLYKHRDRLSRLLIMVLVVVLFGLSFVKPQPAVGQATWGASSGNLLNLLPDDKVKSLGCYPLYTQGFYSLLKPAGILVSMNINPVLHADVQGAKCQSDIGTLSQSAIDDLKQRAQAPSTMGYIAQATDVLYNEKPTSGIVYAEMIYDKAVNQGKVYAQAAPYFPGLGFTLFQPLQGIWGWTVNFVYGLMILIILSIAFAMMFQNSLGGQTVVQLQSAIPNLIIAMVLIPLSYPITAFAVDFMVLGANIVHGVVFSGTTAFANQFYENGNLKFSGGFLGALNDVFQVSGSSTSEPTDPAAGRGLYIDDNRVSVWRIFTLINYDDVQKMFAFTGGASNAICPPGASASSGRGGCDLLLGIQAAVSSLTGGINGSTSFSLAAIITDVIYIIISFAAIFTAVRMFIILIKRYILWFMLVPVISPLIFASIAVPGQGTKTIIDNMKKLYGTSVMFIFTYAMFLVIVVLSNADIINVSQAVNQGFVPPLLGNLAKPITDVATNTSISPFDALMDIVALAIFFGMPVWMTQLEEKLGLGFEVPQQFKEVVGGFGGSLALGGQTLNAGRNAATSAYTGVRTGFRNTLGGPDSLRARFNRMRIGRQDERRTANDITAKTRSQQLEDEYTTQIREGQRELLEAGNPVARMRAQSKINAAQAAARRDLGKEITATVTTGISWVFNFASNKGSQQEIRVRGANSMGLLRAGSVLPGEGEMLVSASNAEDKTARIYGRLALKVKDDKNEGFDFVLYNTTPGSTDAIRVIFKSANPKLEVERDTGRVNITYPEKGSSNNSNEVRFTLQMESGQLRPGTYASVKPVPVGGSSTSFNYEFFYQPYADAPISTSTRGLSINVSG